VSTVYRARDFVETQDQLLFAVVSDQLLSNRLACCLRYLRQDQRFRKLDTRTAQELLRGRHPSYLSQAQGPFGSLHVVPTDHVHRHYVPHRRAREILDQARPCDPLEETARRFLTQLIRHGIAVEKIGVTGSLLIGAHGRDSDIDILIQGRELFHEARNLVRRLLADGGAESLTEDAWRVAHERRGCSLAFAEYLWHEQRKWNKLCLNHVKIDVSMASAGTPGRLQPFRKLRRVDVTAQILDDHRAFDHPASWQIESPVAGRLISWTPTFTGQAFRGETVHVRGWLEAPASGRGDRQIVVGTSREAVDEWIRVVRHGA
jgi:uncharacterized protein